MKTLKFSTNIETEIARDELYSVFKSDHRIEFFSINLGHPQKLLTVVGEVESAEIIIKINSIGFDAIEIHK